MRLREAFLGGAACSYVDAMVEGVYTSGTIRETSISIGKKSVADQGWLSMDRKAHRRAWRFRCFYFLVTILATPRAVYLYLLLHIRSAAAIAWLRDSQLNPWTVTRDIAATRLVRKIQLVTGWTASPAIVWPKTVPASCVIAYFHSNWDMIIACEFDKRRWCLMRTHEDWAKRLGTQYVDWKNSPRTLIRSVNEGSRVGVAIDTSVNVTVSIAHASIDLSTNPFRIAALTGTPVVPVWPIYERGVLQLAAGKPINVSNGDVDYKVALNFAGQCFGYAIQRDPASWRKIFPFLMRLNNA